MTALQAAIGKVQLKKLDKFNDIRRQNAAIYTEALSNLELQLPVEKPYAWSVFHVYSVLIPTRLASQRDEIVNALLKKRVPAAVAHPSPLYTSPVFEHLTGPFDCPVAEDVSSRVITLPTAQSISKPIARDGAITGRSRIVSCLMTQKAAATINLHSIPSRAFLLTNTSDKK